MTDVRLSHLGIARSASDYLWEDDHFENGDAEDIDLEQHRSQSATDTATTEHSNDLTSRPSKSQFLKSSACKMVLAYVALLVIILGLVALYATDVEVTGGPGDVGSNDKPSQGFPPSVTSAGTGLSQGITTLLEDDPATIDAPPEFESEEGQSLPATEEGCNAYFAGPRQACVACCERLAFNIRQQECIAKCDREDNFVSASLMSEKALRAEKIGTANSPNEMEDLRANTTPDKMKALMMKKKEALEKKEALRAGMIANDITPDKMKASRMRKQALQKKSHLSVAKKKASKFQSSPQKTYGYKKRTPPMKKVWQSHLYNSNRDIVTPNIPRKKAVRSSLPEYHNACVHRCKMIHLPQTKEEECIEMCYETEVFHQSSNVHG